MYDTQKQWAAQGSGVGSGYVNGTTPEVDRPPLLHSIANRVVTTNITLNECVDALRQIIDGLVGGMGQPVGTNETKALQPNGIANHLDMLVDGTHEIVLALRAQLNRLTVL